MLEQINNVLAMDVPVYVNPKDANDIPINPEYTQNNI